MLIIYLFSARPYSGNETRNIIDQILPSLKENIIETINFIIRKIAHLTEYFILAYLIHNLLKEYTKKEKIRLALSIIICFIYSITDEIHQSHVPGRTGILTDCLIDTLGGCIFIITHKLSKYR